MAVTNIYGCGSNGNYQLGLGHDEDLNTPKELKSLTKTGEDIIQIASGGNHTLAVTKNGRLYGCGLTKSGQLTGEKDHVIEWDPIYTGFPVVKAAAGWEFSVVVSADNAVYTTGRGSKGELGNSSESSSEFRPIEGFPPAGKTVKDVKAGMAHVVALLDDGSVYGWGAGRKGQLGQPLEKAVSSPRLIKDCNTTHIACGREYTILGNSNSGSIEMMGKVTEEMRQSIPQLDGFKDLQSGWSTAHVLLQNGKVKSWGNNSNGQLAPADLDSYNITSISAGTEHVVALSDQDQCIAWGWSEHGNCGEATADGVLSVLASNTGVQRVWGGYATTFFG